MECLLYCIYPSCVFVLILPFPHPLRAAEVHSSPKHPCNTFVMVFLISSRFDLAPLFWIRWGFSSLAYLPWKPRHINVSSGNHVYLWYGTTKSEAVFGVIGYWSEVRRRCFSCVGSSWSVSYLCCSCSSSRGVRSCVLLPGICPSRAFVLILPSSPKRPRNVVILSGNP